MKSKLIIAYILIFGSRSFAQQIDPAHFAYSVKKINDKQYQFSIIARVDNGWHIYSQTQPKDAVAEPTKISFYNNPLIVISGKPKEIGKKQKYEDKVVGIVQYHYSDSVVFVQTVTLKSKVKTNLNGTITYQVCTDERCLPPTTINFSVKLN